MKKYIIHVPHKSGSVINGKILRFIYNTKLTDGTIYDITNKAGLAQVVLSRYFPESASIEDHIVMIPRNPVSALISRFYSFGYTHTSPKHKTSQEHEEAQEQIRQAGIEQYITDNISRQSQLVRDILHSPHQYKCIIPYEVMISNFQSYLSHLLDFLDMSDSFQRVYDRWSGEFVAIKDRTSEIEAGSMKPHKRTTDIYEWKKKLDEDFLVSLLKECPFISEYDKYLKEWL